MKMKKRFLSILLSLVMVLGLVPGMSLTAYADNPYTGAAKIKVTDVGGRIKNASTDWAVGSPTTRTVTLKKTSLPCTFSLSDLSGNSNNITGLTTNSGTNVVIDQTYKTVTINDLGSSEIVVNTTNNSGYKYKHTYTFEVTGLATYSVTLHTNDGTISEGKNVTSYVQEMGAALPTSADITNGDKVFEGWFDNSGLTGNAVTSISTTDTGNKEYWAKWKTPHTHSFTYTASGATITATCTAAGCTLPPSTEGGIDHVATLTIAANGGTYDGTTAYGATITDGNSIQGDAKVQYQKKNDGSYGTATETAPTDAGDYKASITVGGATASVEYTIAQATTTITVNPTAGDITYGQTLANSSLTGGTASVAGSFTWKDSTIAPAVSDSQTTNYDVVFTPTDGNYGTAECKVKLTVNKADSAVTKAPTAKTLTYTGSPQALVSAGTAEGGEIQYALGTMDAATEPYTTSIPAKTDAGTYYVWYKAVGDSTHTDSKPVCVTVTIGEKIVYTAVKTSATVDEHTIGSGEDAVLVFQRSVEDEKTITHFTSAAVDGKTLSAGDYSIKSGSLILTLKASYLDTLTPGAHQVTATFDDGSADTTITILETPATPAPTDVPKTGDGADLGLWLTLMLAGLLLLGGWAVVTIRKRS